MNQPYPTFKPVGHNEALKSFLKAWEHDKLHHAWLFCGQKSIGKAGVAHYLARFILSEKLPQKAKDANQNDLFSLDEVANITKELTLDKLDVPLDTPEIQQYFASSNPNFIYIARQADEKTGKLKAAIGVDAIRQMNRQLAVTRKEGYRVIIVDSIDEMNINAANAILKTLEEPPKNTIFFLISHNPNKLLPTITSRCRKLHFSPLNQDDMQRLMEKEEVTLNTEDKQITLWLANGSIGRALQLSSEKEQGAWQEILEFFGQLNTNNLSKIPTFCRQYAKVSSGEEEQKFTLFIDIWMRLIQAGCLNAAEAKQAIPNKIEELLSKKSQKPLDEWLQLWDKTIRISKQLLSGDIDRTAGLNQLFLALSNL